MNKPQQIRDVLYQCLPELNKNRERLTLVINKGNAVATGAASMSFEWQYELQIGVIDFAGHPDAVMVPLLLWLRQYQPELFTNPDRRDNAVTIEVEYLARDLVDMLITVPLTERVRVTKDETGMRWEHLQEPPEDPYDGMTWELFINDQPQPWPPAPGDTWPKIS
ncbi:phage tail protein [Aeromonas veronii]